MLEKLRKKPKSVRDSYAFFGAIVVTSMIALVWVSTFSTRIEEATLATEIDAETTGAFSRFFSDAKQNVATVFSGISSSTNGFSEETPVQQATTTLQFDTEASSTPASPADETLKSFTFEAPEPPKRTILIETVSQQEATSTAP